MNVNILIVYFLAEFLHWKAKTYCNHAADLSFKVCGVVNDVEVRVANPSSCCVVVEFSCQVYSLTATCMVLQQLNVRGNLAGLLRAAQGRVGLRRDPTLLPGETGVSRSSLREILKFQT